MDTDISQNITNVAVNSIFHSQMATQASTDHDQSAVTGPVTTSDIYIPIQTL